jgi:hypothetical protein
MRKQLLFLLLAGVITIQASAQIERNRLYTELSAGRYILNFTANTFQPSVSYGISEHSAISAFYKYQKFKSYPGIYYNGYSTKSGGGISYNYYHYFNKKSKWGWSLNASLGVFKINVYDKQGGIILLNNRYTEKELTVTPGLFFKPSPRLMFFTNIGGLSLVNYHGGTNINNGFSKQLNIGVQLRIGGAAKKQQR